MSQGVPLSGWIVPEQQESREELSVHQSPIVHQLGYPLRRHAPQHLVVQELFEASNDAVRKRV